MEIRKREAKVFLMSRQIEDHDDTLEEAQKENLGNVNIEQLEHEKQNLHKSIQQQQE